MLNFSRITSLIISILKTLLFLSKSQLGKTINKINNKFIRIDNRSNNTIFLFKSKKFVKNWSKSKSNRILEKFNFLIFNTKEVIKFLK